MFMTWVIGDTLVVLVLYFKIYITYHFGHNLYDYILELIFEYNSLINAQVMLKTLYFQICNKILFRSNNTFLTIRDY